MTRPPVSALAVAVRVTPGASRARVGGVWRRGDDAPRLVVRVPEAPEGGRATAAVATALAAAFGVAKSAVTLKQGGASRLKTYLVEGDVAALAARLALLLQQEEAGS